MSDRRVEEVEAAVLIDLRHRVLRAGRPRETAHLPGDDAPTTRHFRLVEVDRTVAIASVMAAPFPDGPDGPALQLRGMAVAPERQGEGLGGELLRAVQATSEALWCNARLRAVPFYVRHGWRILGDAFEVPAIGPHHRMVWSATTTTERE